MKKHQSVCHQSFLSKLSVYFSVIYLNHDVTFIFGDLFFLEKRTLFFKKKSLDIFQFKKYTIYFVIWNHIRIHCFVDSG